MKTLSLFVYCFFITVLLIKTNLVFARTDSVTIRLNTTHSRSPLLSNPPILPVNQNPMDLLDDSAAIRTTITHQNGRETWIKFKIERPCTIMLMDLFGHEIYVRPGDVVDISLDTIADMTKPLVADIPNPWSVRMKFEGPGKYYHAFFDSIAYVAGVLHIPSISILKYNNNLTKYFEGCKKQYAQRLNFMFNYVKRHKLNKEFLRLATNEIKSTYILALLQPFKTMDLACSNVNKLPPAYKAVLTSYNLNELPDFFTTINVSAAYIEWIQYYRTCIVLENKSSEDGLSGLIGMSSSQLKQYPDVDYSVSTYFMHSWLRRKFLPTKYTYEYFNNQCLGNKPCSPVIDSMYHDLLIKGRDTISIKNMMVQSMNGDTLTIKEITGSQYPILIDVWASWCLPCRQQDVYLNQVMKRHLGEFYLLKLSVDRDREAWKKASEKSMVTPEHGFLIPGNFESAFAKYFNINAIPRYILLNERGEVVNDNMPYPSRKEEFETALKSVLN